MKSEKQFHNKKYINKNDAKIRCDDGVRNSTY